jgi:hypothetical protein
MKKKFCFFLAFILIINFSCVKRSDGECDLPPNVNHSSINITFIDSLSGKYLYAETNPIYNKDSLKILDPNGNSLVLLKSLDAIPNTYLGYWVINFGSIYTQQTDGNSFNSELCKNFIIKYTHNLSDTIQVYFKSKETKCGSVFETLKVYHKERLLATVTNNTFAEITISRN